MSPKADVSADGCRCWFQAVQLWFTVCLQLYGPYIRPCSQLNPVYTIQPVIQPVRKPAVSCKQTFNRLSNGFDNWFDNRVERSALFAQPVVKPRCTTGLRTGCIHDTAVCQTGLTTGCIV